MGAGNSTVVGIWGADHPRPTQNNRKISAGMRAAPIQDWRGGTEMFRSVRLLLREFGEARLPRAGNVGSSGARSEEVDRGCGRIRQGLRGLRFAGDRGERATWRVQVSLTVYVHAHIVTEPYYNFAVVLVVSPVC